MATSLATSASHSLAQRRTYLEVCEMIPSSCSRSRSSKLLPLLLKFIALAAFVAGMAVSSQAQDKIELFGGYSYFRASIRVGEATPVGPGIPCPPTCNTSMITQNANLNGWHF